MSTSSIRTTAILAALGAMSLPGFGTSAEVIQRPYYGVGDIVNRPTPRMGNNRPMGPTRAQKKRLRKIARASRRYNLRMGA